MPTQSPRFVAIGLLLAASACATPAHETAAPPAGDETAAQAWEPWPPVGAESASAPTSGSGPEMVLAAKGGGYRIDELCELVTRTTGRPIMFDGANATFKQAKVEFVGDIALPASKLFDWFQSALSFRKLVLIPVGPRLASGEQAWFIMDQADPNLKSRPVYVDERDVIAYADRDGLYVVTTLRIRDTVDATRARNALSPLSTATAGIGRIQDIPGSRTLIVGDFAPVVAAMKRLIDRINADTPPSAVRTAAVPAAPPAAPAAK